MFQGNPVSISGQNTDTITFTAPNVSAPGQIYVSVNVTLDGGTLDGNESDSTTISIVDLDPPPAYNLGQSTSLTPADAIDLSEVMDNSTWRLNQFQYSQIDSGENTAHSKFSSHELVHLIAVNDTTIEVTSCRSSIAVPLDLSNFAPGYTCNSGDRQVNYYQEPDQFRVELMCGEEVAIATSLTKLNNSQATSFGSLSLDFATFDDLSETTDVCGSVAINYLDNRANGAETEAVSSAIKLVSEYKNEALEVQLVLDGMPEMGTYTFGANGKSINAVKITNILLNDLSGQQEKDDGSISLLSDSPFDIDGWFAANITDSNSINEAVEGEFSLLME